MLYIGFAAKEPETTSITEKVYQDNIYLESKFP